MPIHEDRCSFPTEAVTACGVRLLNMWRVKVGPAYRRNLRQTNSHTGGKRDPNSPTLIIVRTNAGEGTVAVGGTEHQLAKDTLLAFDRSLLERYHTSGPKWHFWWVELLAIDPLHLPLHRVFRIPGLPREIVRCDEVFKLLQSARTEQRYLANAAWQHLFFEWRAAAGVDDNRFTSSDLAIQRMLEAFKKDPGKPWTLECMAAAARMSPSSLRKACRALTGESPAKIRLRLKLDHAHEYLRRGDRNVGEVAEALGFCDPFHFSKAFKHQFGFSPSETQSRPG
ncbi:MAG: helix-turn-helix transcriptional regulator [Verrucomicrobia bacterium]|nr:helix-turn-helix transcriptional regulator [Verrucomicrobiota bacterium]